MDIIHFSLPMLQHSLCPRLPISALQGTRPVTAPRDCEGQVQGLRKAHGSQEATPNAGVSHGGNPMNHNESHNESIP